MNVSRYIVTAAACLLVLSGCGAGPSGSEPTATPAMAQVPSSEEKAPSSEPTLGPGEFSDSRGLPFPVPSTETNPIVYVDRKTAWGDKLDITEIPASIDGDHVLVLKAVSEDGKTIAGLVVPRSVAFDNQYKLVLMDVATKHITEIDTISDVNQSAYYDQGAWANIGVALDEQWLLWQENTTIEVYNRATQVRSKIETATDISTGVIDAYAAPSRVISVDQGTVVWAEASEEQPPEGRIATVVKSADVATGRIAVIGKHGVNPVISGPTVAWIEPDLTTVVDGLPAVRLMVSDLKSESTRMLQWLSGPSKLAIHADAIASAGWTAGRANLVNLSGTRRQVILPEQSNGVEWMTLNDRLVAMASFGGEGVRLWDRKLERLVQPDGYSGYTAAGIVNGSALAWQSAPDFKDWREYQSSKTLPRNMSIFVMDTLQLP